MSFSASFSLCRSQTCWPHSPSLLLVPRGQPLQAWWEIGGWEEGRSQGTCQAPLPCPVASMTTATSPSWFQPCPFLLSLLPKSGDDFPLLVVWICLIVPPLVGFSASFLSHVASSLYLNTLSGFIFLCRVAPHKATALLLFFYNSWIELKESSETLTASSPPNKHVCTHSLPEY